LKQHGRVVVHLRTEQDKEPCSWLFNSLKQYEIEYTVLIDKTRWANRKYPYLEVEGRITCVKRLIRMKQENKI